MKMVWFYMLKSIKDGLSALKSAISGIVDDLNNILTGISDSYTKLTNYVDSGWSTVTIGTDPSFEDTGIEVGSDSLFRLIARNIPSGTALILFESPVPPGDPNFPTLRMDVINESNLSGNYDTGTIPISTKYVVISLSNTNGGTMDIRTLIKH